jgi:1-acyl-sn-glycerol-3-phosphate acyltransferase
MTSANVPASPPPEHQRPATPPATISDRVGEGSPRFYAFARRVIWLIRPLIARLHTIGVESVPQSGPVILALNHVAWIDIPLASLRVPRITHYMAKIELFNIPVLGGIMRLLGAFPVRRGEGDRESLRIAERLLSQGQIVVVFPEGHRSGGHLIKAHPGTSLIAFRSGAPVVPVAISGSEHVFKGFHYGPWAPRVTISYGKPIYLKASGARYTRDDLANSTHLIMRRIAEMLPPAYRGEYAHRIAGETPSPAMNTEEERQ